MAVRREAFDRWGVFDTSLGRTGDALTGGEEKELFYRIAAGGGQVWWVPQAVIYHIIPPSKLTPDYFHRLSRGVGVSERVRTLGISKAAYIAALVKEGCKWTASLVIAFGMTLSGRPSKARYLLMMRLGITGGLLM